MKFLSLVLLATLTAATARADVPELKPIRNAKAHIAITKYTWVTSPDPMTKADRVCEKDIEAPVFDARGTTGGWYYNLASFDCASTVGGQAVTVSLNAALMITNMNDPIDHTDRKYFHANMNVGTPVPGGMTAVPGLSSGVSAWSHDIYAKTLGLDLQPSVGWTCSGEVEPVPAPKKTHLLANDPVNQPIACAPSLSEWFTASVEFVD